MSRARALQANLTAQSARVRKREIGSQSEKMANLRYELTLHFMPLCLGHFSRTPTLAKSEVCEVIEWSRW